MPSYEHKRIIETIARLDVPPVDAAAFSEWVTAGTHLTFLRENAHENELVIYGSGDFTFVHAIVVPNDRLVPINRDDLLGWSCNPYTSIASYVSGGGREGMWVERGMHGCGSKTLEAGMQLVFGRTFEGWTGIDDTYFELHQEYSHLCGIHWRSEHRAYCKFDENGDIDPLVSVSLRQGTGNDVSLVSFKRDPLDEYLAASNSSLVRMFDFTLLRRHDFTKWPDGPEQLIQEAEDLFYRQKVIPGHAAYTRGVQIIRPRRSKQEIFDGVQGRWWGRRDRQHAEFIAQDWRNQRIVKISTDPKATTNYFDAKENQLPYELSPAFFRPEVLLKYKADRDKYTLGERDLHCRAAWYLKGIDVNEAGQVHAYICDLRKLPFQEQLHWVSYNEPPKTGISARAISNDFKGEWTFFTDPLRDVLSVARRWHEKRVSWWVLRDEELLNRVNVPITGSRDEWGDAFLDLSKLIIEGFEVRRIRARLDTVSGSYESKDQSIGLLERLLTHGAGDTRRLPGLRTVQQLRTKLKGHSGGVEAVQLAQEALAQHETYARHFKHVCGLVLEELKVIEDLFP
jgi:hypothetical protein